jgi:glycerophosphoryl diester phosphodiesterase
MDREMRVVVVQPPYPSGGRLQDAEDCISWCTSALGELAPGTADLVVLPEYCTVPGIVEVADALRFLDLRGHAFEQEIQAEAERLEACIVYGTLHDGARRTNRTVVTGPDGLLAVYDKTHLTDAESEGWGMSPGDHPVFVEFRGCRIAIAVCFDMYFPEYFAALAAGKPDMILMPSYQRSERGSLLRALSATRAVDTGAYLVRSAYAMPESRSGGHSCVVGPDGTILDDLAGAPGVIRRSVVIGRGYSKPASFGAPQVVHRELIEQHRRPELYRSGHESPSPRGRSAPLVCAHRGLSVPCPENTLPAFGAALGAGADEIELDLWLSADGVPVVCHDPDLARTTDREGIVTQLTWAEVRAADAGVSSGTEWAGVTVPRFEDVLDLVGGRATLNIHVKDAGPDGNLVRRVAELLRESGVSEKAYIAGAEDVLDWAVQICPEIHRACLGSQDDTPHQLEIARVYSCQRIQFGRQVSQDAIHAAKKQGRICNLFWSDDLDDARAYVQSGIDVVLTNRCHVVTRIALASVTN